MVKLSYTINEVRELTGISRSAVYQAIREGRLVAVKLGKRTYVRREDLERFLGGLKPIGGRFK